MFILAGNDKIRQNIYDILFIVHICRRGVKKCAFYVVIKYLMEQ